MKAVIHNSYGAPDLLQLVDWPKPVPQEDEILIKIMAVSLNGSDREGLIGRPLYARINGLFRPGNPILGSDIAGRVVAVGPKHTEFAMGDELFGELPGYHGGLAEYVCTNGRTLLRKPAGLTFVEAAAIPQAGVIALNGIQTQGRVQPGQQVLINGAGGSGGSFAIQLAKRLGAEVTGVDHPEKQAFMRALGADHTIDYTQENFTQTGRQYDLILDLIAHQTIADYMRALRPQGTYFMVGGSVRLLLALLFRSSMIKKRTGKTLKLLGVPQNRADLATITALCEAGQIKPALDRQFPLAETAEAFRYFESGHAQGKIVIEVAQS